MKILLNITMIPLLIIGTLYAIGMTWLSGGLGTPGIAGAEGDLLSYAPIILITMGWIALIKINKHL